jgi:protein phosphatase
LPPPSFQLELGYWSAQGTNRNHNEDSLFSYHAVQTNLDQRWEHALAVVADGMGGYAGGREASTTLVDALAADLVPFLATETSVDSNMLFAKMDASVQRANQQLRQRATIVPELKSMGACLALLAVCQARALIVNVGDCRVYLHRGGALKQLTRDQTMAGELISRGMSEADAALHPMARHVTQAVGRVDTVSLPRHELAIQANDVFVVASDGWTMSGFPPIAKFSALQLAESLARSSATTKDDCTLVVLRVL